MAAAPWNMARRAAIRQTRHSFLSMLSPKISSTRTMASARPNMTVEQVNEALSLLRSQPNHYVVASISGRTFVLSNSDLVTLPRIRDVKLGDVLELDLVHEVGSRDYTLRAQDPAHGARNPEGGRFPLALVRNNEQNTHSVRAVSYTHLTLPTILLV